MAKNPWDKWTVEKKKEFIAEKAGLDTDVGDHGVTFPRVGKHIFLHYTDTETRETWFKDTRKFLNEVSQDFEQEGQWLED